MQVKHPVRIDLTWTAATPLMVNSGTSGDGLVDRFIRRGAHGEAVIPGSALKGRSAYYASSLFLGRYGADALCTGQQAKRKGRVEAGGEGCGCPLCTLYGRGGLAPGQFHFSDLRASRPTRPEVRWSVSRDDWRRIAADHLLTNYEVAPPGDSMTGTVLGYLPAQLAWTGSDGDERAVSLTEALGFLTLGIVTIQTIGSGKSRGLGHGRFRIGLNLDGQPVETAQLKEWCRPWISA